MVEKKLEKLEKEFLGLKKEKVTILLASLPIPFILAAVAFFLGQSSTLILALFSLGFVGILIPYLAFGFLEFREIKRAEEGFPNFLRDLSQSISAGMTLPQAIATCAETKYGILSKYVKKLNIWLSWGIAFPDAWKKFTKSLERSELIKRINGIILEAFYSGGEISVTLNSLASDVNLLKRMESDKKAMMQQHIVVMYVVYFIFLGIIIGLYKILLPILYIQRIGVFGGIALRAAEQISVEYFKNLFFLMTIVQSACVGLIAGQIAEEKLIAGFKHVIVMMAVGAFAFFIFIYPSYLTLDVSVFPTTPALGQKITINGDVFFEANPAAGARIELVTPQQEIVLLFADGLGEFSTTIEAPTQPGVFSITLTATYGGETAIVTKTINVGS